MVTVLCDCSAQPNSLAPASLHVTKAQSLHRPTITREGIRDGEACRIGLTLSGELGPGTTSSGNLLRTDTESGGVEEGGVV